MSAQLASMRDAADAPEFEVSQRERRHLAVKPGEGRAWEWEGKGTRVGEAVP